MTTTSVSTVLTRTVFPPHSAHHLHIDIFCCLSLGGHSPTSICQHYSTLHVYTGSVHMFTWWAVMFDYIFRQNIEQFFLVCGILEEPRKAHWQHRYSRIMAFKLSGRYVSQTVSDLEQPCCCLSVQGMKIVSLYSPNVYVLSSGRGALSLHHRTL